MEAQARLMPEVQYTYKGTAYLQIPGVELIAATTLLNPELGLFPDSFPGELDFAGYGEIEGEYSSLDLVAKRAGQLCYLSMGPKCTPDAEVEKYLQHIKESGHGSVLEHSNVTCLLWGVSRSLTHELVRHRAGFAFSQVSQRYTDGKTLRFVERPEFVGDTELHEAFCTYIDSVSDTYNAYISALMARQGDLSILSAERKTDLRKKVNGCARFMLPNCTEAPIMVTANLRAWRHFLNMRASEAAELEIRRVAVEIHRVLRTISPATFADFEEEFLVDGTTALTTPHKKV